MIARRYHLAVPNDVILRAASPILNLTPVPAARRIYRRGGDTV